MDTLIFTFSNEYCSCTDIIDYYCDVDDETGYLNVYVNDYEEDLLKLADEDLCEFYGLDPEFLVHSNRSTLI